MWLRICTSIECWKCLFGDLVQDKTSGHKTIFHFRPFETSKCQGKVRLALFFFLLYSAFVTIGPRAEIYQKTARLRNRCDRSICPVNVRHAHLHLNTSLSFFHPLNKLSLDNCYHSRTLLMLAMLRVCWPMTRSLRLLLPGWKAYRRPKGYPQLT